MEVEEPNTSQEANTTQTDSPPSDLNQHQGIVKNVLVGETSKTNQAITIVVRRKFCYKTFL